tara:strand:+ start:333 stop:1394 length:1062 start_codon:yes stop_codon:yes gene_type:complete
MIIKKIFSLAASIISLVICISFFTLNSKAEDYNSKRFYADEGIVSIMYHRFNESKYPSTNIQMDIFKKHIKLIQNSNFSFYNPQDFEKNFNKPLKKKKILLTIDDGFKSFYKEAWPFLKKNKIPFILFVSTEPVGKSGYMTWEEIKEVEKADFAFIGHHSHTHDYLIEKTNEEFVLDLKRADSLFLKNLGYVPSLFSYPFGEYSKFMRDYVANNFNIAFGQHSGVIDLNKDKYELSRFPINENYGKIERFKSIINSFPLEYKKLEPIEKKINNKNNPPNLKIEFFTEQKNVENINCYSNEGGRWEKSTILIYNNVLTVKFREAFKPRRGRINCSLNDNGKWRWFGVQFVVNEN